MIQMRCKCVSNLRQSYPASDENLSLVLAALDSDAGQKKLKLRGRTKRGVIHADGFLWKKRANIDL
jgi:hypothetical protein